MDFVWIYAKPFSYFAKSGLWNELEYSIKSVKKNYPDSTIWVVGDDPTPLKANFIPAERIITHVTNCPIDMDVIKKFRVILDSEIGDEFILMYDDIFLLQPMTYEEITTTYARFKVDDIMSYRRSWSRNYKFLWRNTYNLIKEFREDIYDWETHLPRHLKKEGLERVIDEYDCDNIPLIATSLYSAKYGGETVIMDDYTQFNILRIDVNLELGFQCKFMNIMDDSITLRFKEKMTEVFGEGTSFKSPYGRY